MSGNVRSQSLFSRLPTLRFRAKISVGFALVLVISAGSLGIAYLGFEHVSQAVASCRNSVSEADLARNIDRELISYRSAVKHYVVTGKEDDAKAALDAEASLKDAIDKSISGTRNQARLDSIKRVQEFFADLCRHPQAQARQRADRAKRAQPWQTCCATSSMMSPATPTRPSCRRSSSASSR